MIKINFSHIMVAAVLAIIIPYVGSYPYLDDMVRITYNYTGLATQGRFLTEWFYTFMAGGKYTTFPDIYIFNLIFILSGCILTKKYLDRHATKDSESAILLMCIFSSPFILENISYHIDSIGMFSSLYLSIVSAFFKSKSIYKTFITSTIILFIASCFYQFSINVFICSVAIYSAFIAVKKEANNLQVFKYILIKIVSLAVSLACTLLTMKVNASDGYSDVHATIMSVSDINNGLLIKNIKTISEILSSSFNFYGVVVLSIMMATFFIGLIHSCIAMGKERNVTALLLLILAPITCLSMIYLPASLFTKPIIQPRIMIAFGFLMCSLLVPLISLNKTHRFVFFAVISLVALNAMNSSAFNVAQRKIIESSVRISDRIYSNIPDSEKDKDGYVSVIFKGSYEHGMEAERNSKYFPILNHILRDPLEYKSFFLLNGMNRYFRTGVKTPKNEVKCTNDDMYLTSPWLDIKSCTKGVAIAILKSSY